jgi:peptidoglycan/xylan/chitin deacetylase (PgdA/CDA1 family)
LGQQAQPRRANILPVLTYHRVDHENAHPELYPGMISATPAAFNEQMSFLAANYRVVSMPEVLDAARTGAALPPRSVLVTFDDAYRDFAEHAWPILKCYRIPATLFVPTAFPGHPDQAFWWDRLYRAVTGTARRGHLDTLLGRLPLKTPAERSLTFTRLKDYVRTSPHGEAMALVNRVCEELDALPPVHHVLDWEALRELAREGVTLGAHTRTHPLMNRISLAEARAEAVGSLRDLEREIGTVPPILAYPGGGVNDGVARDLERAGFVLGFTTARGINDLRLPNWLRLRRINVGQRTNLAVLRLQLHPWFVYLNRWQRRRTVDSRGQRSS